MKELTLNQLKFLKNNVSGSWNYNHETNLIDVEGGLYLNGVKLKKLPVNLGSVSEMICKNTQIETLKGFPLISEKLVINEKNIKSLEWNPVSVGDFSLYFGENISSLKLLLDVSLYIFENCELDEKLLSTYYHQIIMTEKLIENEMKRKMIELL
jgi:hypothetical protein